MSSPYYGPDEDENTILLERNFLAGDVASGTGYGIQLVLYTSCALFLWKKRKERKSALFLLAYITILIMVETIFVIIQARTVQVLYVDNRNYPGGPWAYFLATQNLAINVIFYATLFVLTFLSDCLVLWRCWVIWVSAGRKLYAVLVITFPTIILIASFVMGTLWTLQSSQPGLSLYSALPLAYGTSFYSISLGLNIILTILIIVRILFYRRHLLKSLPEEFASHYVSLATIIVESAAIYSIFAILFLITYAVNNPANQVLLAFASTAQQVSLYLIIYRLAEGSAWGTQTISQQTITEMKFEPRNIRTATDTVATNLELGTATATPARSQIVKTKSYDEEN